MDEESPGRKVNRRRLLRRAGVVAVTVAGAGAAGAVLATPAEATAGDPITAGGNVNAGVTTTRISNSGLTAPTVALANGAVSGPAGSQQAGPSLRLEPAGDYVLGPKGSMGVDNDGTLWLSNSDTVTGPYSDPVRTGYNSTSLLSFPPVRILETRPQYAGGKASILNPGVVDGNGFVGAGQTLNLSLDSLLVWGYTVFANITVVAGNQAGYLIAYPAGAPRPNASNVNYTPGLVIPNAAVISVGSISGATNAISIYVGGGPTAIIIDISAAVVNFGSDIKPQGSGVVGAQSTEAPVRVRPASLNPKL